MFDCLHDDNYTAQDIVNQIRESIQSSISYHRKSLNKAEETLRLFKQSHEHTHTLPHHPYSPYEPSSFNYDLDYRYDFSDYIRNNPHTQTSVYGSMSSDTILLG